MSDYSKGIYINGKFRPSTAGIPGSEYTDQFGTYHMAAAPALFEPQRVNNFEFQVAGLNDKIMESGNNPYNVPTSGSLSAQEVIRISVDQASAPHFTQAPIEIKRGNSTLKYAGAPTFNQTTIKLKDYIGVRAKDALLSWQNLSYNVETEKVGLASDYKIDCYLKEYTPDYQLVRTWKLYGCWIGDISETGFQSDSQNGVNEITATIHFDKSKPETDEINY